MSDTIEYDWVDLRILELEDKAQNSLHTNVDAEMSDCYYYSQSRKLRRHLNVMDFTECIFEKRNRPIHIGSAFCFFCKKLHCNFQG